MASTESKDVKPKKANLLDQHSIKHLLDETVTEIVTSRGYKENFRLSNIRLLIGTIIIGIALLAQFYRKKFPENRDFLIICIVSYVVLNGLLMFISYTKEKNAILFTNPPQRVYSWNNQYPRYQPTSKIKMLYCCQEGCSVVTLGDVLLGSFTSTGLVVSSKLPRFSDMYTLTIASADPKSISANKPVQFTKSVTKWLTKDGVLVEGIFWKDVERLLDDYNANRKNK